MPKNGVWWNRVTQLVTCGSARPDEATSRPAPKPDHQPKIDINLLPQGDGTIISVIPPETPQDSEIADSHVPVDIVLVIDVSGSMNAAAPVPSEAGDTDGVREDFNLSVLDLTKHAARTIMETLNEGDRLAIVTFSHAAAVLQPLTPMTSANKTSTETTINKMKPLTTTNLWAGIMYGLDQFNALEADSNRVPALMVLTDGMPNHGMPPKGYLAKLREMAPLPATIHTFGFGYHIDSCLLRCIAEVGSGNYSFIPDAGMIGTIFIHAVAHLQTTYATKCTLEIQTPTAVKLSTISGPFINGTIPDDEASETTALHNILRFDLGNIQYGQSRDIYLKYQGRLGHETMFGLSLPIDKLGTTSTGPTKPVMTATLTYSLTRKTSKTTAAEKPLMSHSRPSRESSMAESMIHYHKYRAMMCEFLGSFMKPHLFSGYASIPGHAVDALGGHRERLKEILELITAYKENMTTELGAIGSSQDQAKLHKKLLNSLVLDLEGQVSMALSRQDYFNRWALPYFASLSHAHSRQLCNTFKDPGVQQYNQNDFFRRCRDNLDEAFEKIEPPAPSRVMPAPRANIRPSNPILNAQYNHGDGSAAVPPPYSPMSREGTAPPAYTARRINMAAYNDRDGSCFAADTMVQLASEDGRASQQPERIRISELRRGSLVHTPAGPRKVRYIVQSCVTDMPMCRIKYNPTHSQDNDGREGGFLVTPWHPIRIQTLCAAESTSATTGASDDSWIFPANAPHNISSPDQTLYTGNIFSLMLEPDVSPDSHAILVSGPSDEVDHPSERGTSAMMKSARIWGVTLGHGITRTQTAMEEQSVMDARAHAFFGDYAAVEASLSSILDSRAEGHGVQKPGMKRKAEDQLLVDEVNSGKRSKLHDAIDASAGVVAISGVKREGGVDGLVCGFHGL